MGFPEPVTPPELDFNRRSQSAYDLEVTLVGFLTNLYADKRLDNPTLSVAQIGASGPWLPLYVGQVARFVAQNNGVSLEVLDQTSGDWIQQALWTEGDFVDSPPVPSQDPDSPPIPFDPTQRAQTLALKVAPRVVRGRIPRTVTGDIAADRLPDVPNVIVQAVKAKVESDCTHVTVRICFSTFDENPDGSGYQEVLVMIEQAVIALTQFGQQGIDKAYPIVMPIEWQIGEKEEAESLSHHFGEMTTTWELPSARPLPDADKIGMIPAENLEVLVGGAP